MADIDWLLDRKIFTELSTLGDLILPNNQFECNTLEDTCRRRDLNGNNILDPNEKVWGETAIPAGRYEIKMQWSAHFQRDMPHLQNVPNFSCIMIHWGNSPKDTLGCILVGSKTNNPDFVAHSQDAYKDLEPKILSALKEGKLFLTVSGGYTA